jgi:hypothetical protein
VCKKKARIVFNFKKTNGAHWPHFIMIGRESEGEENRK